MSITPYEFSEIEEHKSLPELLNFLQSLNTVSDYTKLKAAAKSIWVRNVVGLMAIDRFHGWDASDPDACSAKVMPEEAREWCKNSGLDTPDRIKAARRIGRVALTTGFDVAQLIEDVGVSKLEVIGRRGIDIESTSNLLNAASEGVSTKELKKHPLYSARGNSPSDEHRDLKESTNDSTEEIAQLKAQLAKAEAEAARAKAVKPKVDTTAQDQLSAVLKKIVPGGYRTLPVEKQVELATQTVDSLNKRVEEAEDITKVTPQNLEHRLECVNLDAVRWGDLAYCFGAAREVCTDASMIARAEDGVRKSWTAWIEHLPIDMLSDMKSMIDNRLNEQDDCSVRTMTTIDV